MADFLTYMIQVSAVFIVLYLFYRLALSKLTFHGLNRGFMLALLPLSLLIPILDIGISPVYLFQDEALLVPFEDFGIIDNGGLNITAANTSGWSVGAVLGLGYLIGMAFGMMKIIWNTIYVFKIKRRFPIYTDGKFKIIESDGPLTYSYFKWIFVPVKDRYDIDGTIIHHEKLHGLAGHTIDLIIAELFVALQWFNPFVYLYRRDLKAVHEYQVDAKILQADIKKSDYLQLMLDHLVQSHKTVGLYNYFNGLTIKKRVQMISKNKSSKWQLTSYVLLLPIMAFMAMSFSSSESGLGMTPSLSPSSISGPGLGNTPSQSPIKVGDYKKVSATYGMHVHPFEKVEKFHSGIDFAAEEGTPIVASADGVVVKVENLEDSYGKLVVINHGDGFETWYAHMNGFAVEQDDKVKQGEVVGYVGSTGKSTGPHLHYEVHKDGKHVNPEDYITE